MKYSKENTLAEVVKSDFKTARVFEKYNLDFCCKGNRSIASATEERKLDSDKIVEELNSLINNPSPSSVEDNWSIDFLVQYILNTHHSYLKNIIPVIFNHSQKVSEVHGNNHPEVREIADIYMKVANELESHMMKEEKILFPAILKLVDAEKNSENEGLPPYGSIKNPIAVMESEHTEAGDGLYKIRELSNNYIAPEDACTTYRVLFNELKEFEEDLHKHVHLENNILFPKSIRLEEKLTKV